MVPYNNLYPEMVNKDKNLISLVFVLYLPRLLVISIVLLTSNQSSDFFQGGLEIYLTINIRYFFLV